MSQGGLNRGPRTARLQTIETCSLSVWRPDVEHRGVGRATLPLEASGQDPSLLVQLPGLGPASLQSLPPDHIAACVSFSKSPGLSLMLSGPTRIVQNKLLPSLFLATPLAIQVTFAGSGD